MVADGNTAAAIATLQMWRALIYPGFLITPSTKWIETVAAKVGAEGHQRSAAARSRARGRRLHGRRRRGLPGISSSDGHQLGRSRSHDRDDALAGHFGPRKRDDHQRVPARRRTSPCASRAIRPTRWRTVTTASSRSARAASSRSDTVIQAPCLGMHPEVMTPTMPGLLRHQGQPPELALHRRSRQRDPRVPGPLAAALPPAGHDQRRHRDGQLRHVAAFRDEQISQKRPHRDACSASFRRSGRTSRRRSAVRVSPFLRRDRVAGERSGGHRRRRHGPDYGTFESVREAWEEEQREQRLGARPLRLLNRS